MRTKKRIAIITVTIVFMLVMTITGLCERVTWDCPECGKKGNTGKFCGGCGHPAPSNDEEASERSENVSLAVGDMITFGTYPQTSKGTDQTPIEWIVLDVQEGKALLLSKYGLDAKQFNSVQTKNITWEKCTLRSWLNNDFLNTAFSEKEQAEILITEVDNSASQGYSRWITVDRNNTKDQVFLLSCSEANKYLEVTYFNHNNTKSRVTPTAYAEMQGAFADTSNRTVDNCAAGWWWLRSPGNHWGYASGVTHDGSLRSYMYVNDSSAVVRPALWINLDSDIF